MAIKNFDLVVIGAGPGGYVAAIRAAQLGLSVAVIEREHLGGICLNWGCIPTKALLKSADVLREMRRAADYGLAAASVTADLPAVVRRSRAVADQLQAGVKHLLKKNKVAVIEGQGKLIANADANVDANAAGAARIAVSRKDAPAENLSAKSIILATGARPRVLPGLEPDGRLVWTYRGAMIPEALPASLLVVGSGAIGVEFASFYRTLGSEVTVVEVLDRVLPLEDEEISGLARKAFEKQGMRIVTGATVKSLERGADSVTATIETRLKSERMTFERVIVAVGTEANIEGLGLEGSGVRIERGRIKTDAWCETGAKGIYAIGDVTAGPWLAHKASHEGILVAERIAGLGDLHPVDPLRIPACTYCYPQIASVGLSERRALEAGRQVKVGRFPLSANGKAIALGEAEGLVKTIFDAASGELLGAHMIGPEVTELVQGFVIGQALEATEADLMHAIFPHPTLSEAMHESVLHAFGRAIHI
jgi:dihydrolipoamide dehydrogenase